MAGTIKPKTKRARPILSIDEFSRQHRAKAAKLDAYVHRNYRNKVELPKDLLDELTPQNEMALYANNMESRIGYVRIMHDVLAPFLLAETRPLYWITLTPRQYSFDFDAACRFDVQRLQAWTRQLLPGLSFVGFVDVACYPIPGSRSALEASFHVHLIGWGLETDELHNLEVAANLRWDAYVRERPVFHWRQTSPAQANERIFYMAKATLKASRWVPMTVEQVDNETGEVRRVGQDRHYEQSNKTGQFARMSLIMQGRTLDKLSFAAGEGKTLHHAINGRALARFRRYERQLDDRLGSTIHLTRTPFRLR